MEAEWASPIADQLAQLEPWYTLAYTPDALGRYLSAGGPDSMRFAVLRKGTIAGAVCVRFPWLRGVYLELIGLFPQVQGQGIGRAVCSWLEQEVDGHADNLWTLVSSFNSPARRFYANCHFTEIGVLKDFVRPGHDEILMRRITGKTR
jgi:ribosomal protein S18 acetylase RimI-like enzyme